MGKNRDKDFDFLSETPVIRVVRRTSLEVYQWRLPSESENSDVIREEGER
jgi:hypothetical protein